MSQKTATAMAALNNIPFNAGPETVRLDRLTVLARQAHALLAEIEACCASDTFQAAGSISVRLRDARKAMGEAFAGVAAATLIARYDLEAKAS